MPLQRMRRTKIVSTLGPASSSPEMIEKLILAGVNVFRLNFSHGKQDDHCQRVLTIREIADRLDMPVGILQDLQGPKIRVTTFADGKVELEPEQAFALTCADDSPGDTTRVGVTYPDLYNDVRIGDSLLLDDGRLRLEVKRVEQETIHTTVQLGGTLSNNKGINIPNADLSIPALTDKDVDDLLYGAELDVDWVAMSFVRSRDDILLARHYLKRAGSKAKLMAKIEKPGAVERFADILQEVDGVMVARGDLGVELPPERVPLIQKRLIHMCVQAGKPVVTATQMLESMISSPTPTRAEASDVANAIYDGTDAIMLSGETAVGHYPIETVAMMDRIAISVENDARYQESMSENYPTPDSSTADSVSLAAAQIAHQIDARLIVTFTSSGTTARRVSRNRPPTRILAITPSKRAYQQLAMVWGVRPAISDDIHNTDEMVRVAHDIIDRIIGLDKLQGERYLITAGIPFGVRGTTNFLRVERIQGNRI